jgi:hypothetical protein
MKNKSLELFNLHNKNTKNAMIFFACGVFSLYVFKGLLLKIFILWTILGFEYWIIKLFFGKDEINE